MAVVQHRSIYTSLPLDLGKIRLLRLLPAIQYQAPLTGHLYTAALKAQPEFEALSYTWEPPIEGQVLADSCIKITDQHLKIKGNLDHALRRLRRKFRPRILWIDAICIDQGNPTERTDQVRSMAKIYSSATLVMVWLGEDSPSRDGKFVLGLSRKLNPYYEGAWVEETHRLFAARKYFHRRWIIQEICYANDIVVLCGDYSVKSWESFLSRIQAEECANGELQSFLQFIDHLRMLRQHREANVENSVAINPLTTLCRFRLTDCKDPTDRIGALTSLWSRFPFRFSYTDSVEEVYRSFSKMIVQGLTDHVSSMTQLLFIAAYQASFHEMDSSALEQLSSWIPDWRLQLPQELSGLVPKVCGLPRAKVGMDAKLEVTLRYYGEMSESSNTLRLDPAVRKPNGIGMNAVPLTPSTPWYFQPRDILCESGLTRPPFPHLHGGLNGRFFNETDLIRERICYPMVLRPSTVHLGEFRIVGMCLLQLYLPHNSYKEAKVVDILNPPEKRVVIC